MAVDSTGLRIRRYPDIMQGIIDRQDSSILAPLVHNEQEAIYILSTIFALETAKVEQLLQEVYNSSRLRYAEDKNLDDIAAERKVKRKDATASFTNKQKFTGDNGTIINVGSLFQNPSSGAKVTNTSLISLSNLACYDITLSIDVVAAVAYKVTIDGTDYVTPVMSLSDSKADIISELYDAITDNIPMGYYFTVQNNGETLKIAIDPLVATTDTIKVVTTSFIKTESVSVLGYLESVETGEIPFPIGTVTKTISSVPGLKSTTNLEAYTLGTLLETDEELRDRIANTTNTTAGCTELNIEAALLNNVLGVSSVNVIQNDTNVTDGDGRPPKSYEVIVTGGTDQAVAKEIWRTKPAGVSELYSSTSNSEIIVDSSGVTRTIKFTRPVKVNMAVRVTYTAYSEETLPSDAEDLMSAIIQSYINGLGNNVDVIPSRMIGPIYAAMDGLDSVVVEAQEITTPGDTPVGGSWTVARNPISAFEYAGITPIDIYFVGP